MSATKEAGKSRRLGLQASNKVEVQTAKSSIREQTKSEICGTPATKDAEEHAKSSIREQTKSEICGTPATKDAEEHETTATTTELTDKQWNLRSKGLDIRGLDARDVDARGIDARGVDADRTQNSAGDTKKTALPTDLRKSISNSREHVKVGTSGRSSPNKNELPDSKDDFDQLTGLSDGTRLAGGPSQKSGRHRSKSADPVKSVTARTSRSIPPKNHLLTDYYPVRRSTRQTKADRQKEEKGKLERGILAEQEDGLKVVQLEGKGRGVIATKAFHKGEFVVVYAGDLIDLTEAKHRELQYAEDPDKGCYMYYFCHRNRKYCIDATKESGKLGRLLNHSKNGNCQTKLVDVGGRPYLILVAKEDLSPNTELLYDYGDRSRASLESHPWLKL